MKYIKNIPTAQKAESIAAEYRQLGHRVGVGSQTNNGNGQYTGLYVVTVYGKPKASK